MSATLNLTGLGEIDKSERMHSLEQLSTMLH